MIPVLTLLFLAVFLNFLPYNWILFVPVIVCWGVISWWLARFAGVFIDEWLDGYRD